MAKKPVVSRRGKSAWVTTNGFGENKVVSGQTAGGAGRAATKYNASKGALASGNPRKGKYKSSTGRDTTWYTGGGF